MASSSRNSADFLALLQNALLGLAAVSALSACGAAPASSDTNEASAAPQGYGPPTRRDEKAGDDYHGTWIPDPYRWLENQDGEETLAWTSTQNQATETFLSAMSGRSKIRTRLAELWNYERYSPPSKAGKRWYFSHNDGLRNQSVILSADQPEGPGETFLDPNDLSTDGTIAVGSLSFSHDGRYLAWSFSRSGSDWREFKVRNVATGEDLPDHIRWTKFTTATWLPDDSGFLYARYPEPEEGKAFEAANRSSSYCLHKIGTDPSKDIVLYHDTEHPERHTGGTVSDDGKFLVLTITTGTDARNRISIREGFGPDSKLVPLISELKASYRFLGNNGRNCLFLTDENTPRRSIVSINLDDKSKARTVLVPETSDTLESAQILDQDKFVLVYLHNAHHVVKVVSLDGKVQKTATLPSIGSVSGFTGRRKDSRTFFSFQSFTRPPSIFELKLEDASVKLVHQPKIAFDPEAFVTKQVAFQSQDGTRIPMFMVHKPDIYLNGQNPTYLYGYGGFNISLKPRFSPANIAWLEMGGIFAQPTLRGGGEFGRDWHEAGMLKNKQSVFDDFIGAAQYLQRNHYTSQDRLAVGGGSNGGLLVGAVLTQRPELFGAAIPRVGVLDMLRYHKFTIGHAWIPEYGSSADPEMFKVLRAYSPLHNIQAGSHYPPTLVMTGDHDDRVLPGHSYKFAATLQRSQGGDSPILIRVDSKAGHGAGKPIAKRIDEAADVWTFLAHSLGMDN
jgi:prolyl oligopeptidase